MRKILNHELKRLTTEEFQSAPKIPLYIVLDDVRSMHNVGSVFRSSDAFRVEKIFLCGNTPIPPHREIQKTALGATESVSWEYRNSVLDVMQQLKEEKVKAIAVEQAEGSYQPQELLNLVDNRQKYALLLGNEVLGVSQDAVNECDYCLEIPQLGTKHSLNISVCAGIVIWEFFKILQVHLK